MTVKARSARDLTTKLFRGLADRSRLAVLEALRNGPLSVGQIVARTALSQPNASTHLACLAECGLVARERRGRFVEYAIADKRVIRLLDRAEELLLRVGPLIEACPRYRSPARSRGARRGKRRR